MMSAQQASGETIVTQSHAGQGPIPFDALKLAAGQHTLSGVVDAKALERVADRLVGAGHQAIVEWRVSGDVDPSGRPVLTVVVDGKVPLLCQRCLQPFDWKVEQETVLLLARSEGELVALDADEPEVVLANVALDARALVEDELLLSLPFSPRHPEGECDLAVPMAVTEPVKASPFARLTALKSGDDSNT